MTRSKAGHEPYNGRIWPFVTALSIGVVIIIATRMFGASAPIISSFVAVALASATIVFLAWYQWTKKDQIAQTDPTEIDRIGDELYYIGLIFTLVSLIIGLIFISIADQYETREAVTHLVGSFAIALISTLVGIVLRVLFQSARRTDIRLVSRTSWGGRTPKSPTEDEPNPKVYIDPSSSILEATIKFENELRTSIEVVEQFRRQFHEEKASFTLLVNGIANELDANLKEFPRISKEALHVTSTQLFDVSKKVIESFGKESSKLCEDTIKSLQHTCESTLSSIEERSKETMEQIALRSNDHLNNLSEIYAGSETLVKGTVDKIEHDTTAYLQTVELAISQTSTLVEEAVNDMRRHTSKLSALSSSVNDNLRLGVDSLQVLDRTARTVTDTLSQVKEPAISTEKVAKTIAADITTAKTELNTVLGNLEQLQPTLSTAKQHSDAIGRDLETVRNKVKELRCQVESAKRPSTVRKFITKIWPGKRHQRT